MSWKVGRKLRIALKEGRRVNRWLGIGVGAMVGLVVIRAVGVMVGLVVILIVGLIVGREVVGARLGRYEGAMVGLKGISDPLSEMVGTPSEGTLVGTEDGSLLGWVVGSDDGKEEGMLVGDKVGALVILLGYVNR